MTKLLPLVTRALRLIGVLASGETPTAEMGADMLLAANAMKRGWFGTLIGPRLSPFAIAGSSGQAETGGEYMIGGTAAMTLLAPAHPRPGARFGVVDAGVNFSSMPLTIQGNGVLIAGAGSVTLNTTGASARYWFRPDAGSWILEADWVSLQDTVEFPDVLAERFPAMLAVELASEFGQDIAPEVALAAQEGRMALARSYGRRGLTGLDPAIGLAQAAAPQPQPAGR